MSALNDFYDEYGERERLGRRRSRTLERDTTELYLRRYIPDASEVADIGAGAGAYSFGLAARCARVLAVDIVEKHVREIRERCMAEGISNLESVCASATDLSHIPSGSYDAVLCLGPLYHLKEKKDRLACLSECRRIAKDGGVIFVAYINKLCAMQYYYANAKPLSRALLTAIEEGSAVDSGGFDRFLELSYFSDPDEVAAELAACGLTLERQIGVDGIAYFIQDRLDELSDEDWAVYRDLHFRHCEDGHAVGMSMHGLAICRKGHRDTPGQGSSGKPGA